MSKITLITGGARSGKSSYAEHLLYGNDDVLYVATAIRTDQEMEARIEHHIKSRNQKWDTSEGYKDLGEVLSETNKSFILLDCVTNMVSNLLFASDQDLDQANQITLDELYQGIYKEFQEFVKAARSYNKTLILVSNEVGMGLISEYKLGRVFVDFAGWINQWLAKEADEVTFMVSGLPLHLKQDQIPQDSMKQEQKKQEPMMQEPMRQEPVKQETPKQDSMTGNAIHHESMQQATRQQGSRQPGQVKQGSIKKEALKQNPSEDV